MAELTFGGTSSRSKVRSTICLGGSCVMFLIIGLLIGFLTNKRSQRARTDTYDQDVTADMIRQIDPEKLLENLKLFASKPHVAGTEREQELSNLVKSIWEVQGMDEVKIVPYNVLLSYPNETNPNKVYLLDKDGKIIYTSSHQENITNTNETIPSAFNAYSPSGDVTGDLVYVNFGTMQDFDELDRLRISVKDKICIARYGKIFRGNKLEIAQKRGAIGMIIFMDPSQVANQGTEPENVYPNSWWVPGDAVQRGSVIVADKGDVLTPGYPSREKSPRIRIENASLPTIPCQPIGYSDAKILLKDLIGIDSPKDWEGGLNVTKLGPGLANGLKVRLVVNNYNERRNIYNVIGIIRGHVEPDRYVLYGNHRDAWGFGSLDPSSGTAQMLETTRIIGLMRERGWKPRRSIVFCSWDGEEHNLIGSTEWVEENLAQLNFAVAYVNSDTCIAGDRFSPEASPILATLVKNITKMIPSPADDSETLYQNWKNTNDGDTNVDTLGSGTDHATFSFFAGVPCINYWWIGPKEITLYPAYHTAYETVDYMERIVDPGMKKLQACGRLSIGLVHKLTDEVLIPYDLESLINKLNLTLESLKANWAEKNITTNLNPLQESLLLFSQSIPAWEEYVRTVDHNDLLQVRAVNDRLMNVERQFILPQGLPSRPYYRHAAFAPNKFDAYGKSGFPGLMDYAFQLSNANKTNQSESEIYQLIDQHVNQLSEIFMHIISLIKPLDKHVGF